MWRNWVIFPHHGLQWLWGKGLHWNHRRNSLSGNTCLPLPHGYFWNLQEEGKLLCLARASQRILTCSWLIVTFLQTAKLSIQATLTIKILKKRKNIASKSAEPSPLDSTFAFQHRLGRGRWMVSPEVRKCHHLEVRHRSGSSRFGHIETWVMEGDMLGMCLQKLIYYFSSFSRLSGIGKRGTNHWEGNNIYVPSILFKGSLNVRDFFSRRIYPNTIGLHVWVWAHPRSFFRDWLHGGPPHLHHAQKGSLDHVFSSLLPRALALIQTMLLWGGDSWNVVMIGILSLFEVQVISRLRLKFLQV